MTTIPSRLAQTTKVSINALQARQRALELYRDWYRAAPEICTLYALNATPSTIRNAVRERFDRNRYVTDPHVIDVLLLKSRQEFQETMNCWKLPDHINGILLQTKHRPQRTFLQRFYEGRDDDAAIPAATGV